MKEQKGKETVSMTESAAEVRREQRRLYAETIPYLLHWYEYNRRILPWREDPTPYHVWVSEIMLQQTRVEAVRGYYDRFLASLPDIKALAEAEEEHLLKLWEGLGYYNRVRNMQKAARVLVEQYDGVMPAEYEKIRSLPGIGDYTAGAISSIAFGLPYPAVDGNVLRVMSRIAENEEDIAKEATKQKLKEDLINVFCEQSIPYGDYNQSLMELGATVCLPNGKPLCDTCPVMHLCKAFHAGRETELPVKSGKKERRIENRIVFVVFYEGKILLHKREGQGLLAGLWEFPNMLQNEGMVSELPFVLKKRKKAKHIFSHVEWHMEGLWMELQCGGSREAEAMAEWSRWFTKQGVPDTVAEQEFVFVTPTRMRESYPIPSAFEAFLKEIEKDEQEAGEAPAET